MRRDDGLVDETKKLGGNMNLEEYKRRVENMHSVTGVPTYWEELQNAIAERDMWRDIADRLYAYAADPCTHDHWCDVCSVAKDYEKAVSGE